MLDKKPKKAYNVTNMEVAQRCATVSNEASLSKLCLLKEAFIFI